MPDFSSTLKAVGLGVIIAVIGIAAYTQFGNQSPQIADEDLPAVTVYKSPTCECCSDWVAHMQENGFEVKTTDLADMQQIKNRFNVPRELASCHTAVVGGYVVEGHVPAKDVKRMLGQEANVAGLTVPGMPVGSPGMERGNQLDPYNVLAFSKNGKANIFAKYNQ